MLYVRLDIAFRRRTRSRQHLRLTRHRRCFGTSFVYGIACTPQSHRQLTLSLRISCLASPSMSISRLKTCGLRNAFPTGCRSTCRSCLNGRTLTHQISLMCQSIYQIRRSTGGRRRELRANGSRRRKRRRRRRDACRRMKRKRRNHRLEEAAVFLFKGVRM